MSIMNFILPIIASLPGLLLAFLVYRLDKYDREPRKYLIICFLLGVLITYPALKLEELGASYGLDQANHFGFLLLFAFIVVGLSEEIVKYLCLLFYPYPKRDFDEPMDGIVYATMIGMGFATLENILYSLRYGFDTTIVRAFTAVPAHGIFAIYMGYFVGLAKFNPEKKNKLLALGLIVPVFIHGLYDFFIIQEYFEWLMVFAVVVLLIGAYFGYHLIIDHVEHSPFKDMALHEQVIKNSENSGSITIDDKSGNENEIFDAIVEDLNSEEE